MDEIRYIEKLLLDMSAFIVEKYRKRNFLEVRTKSGPTDVLTEVDIKVQQAIVDCILKTFPDDAIIAEESGLDVVSRNIPDRSWMIDPIDGTQNLSGACSLNSE